MDREHEDKIIKDLEEHSQNITGGTKHPTHLWMDKEDYDFLLEHGQEIIDKIIGRSKK